MTKQVRVGNVFIGGGAPVSIQSMTNTDTRDVRATVEQIARLADAGCEIVRCAVPDMEAAEAIRSIKKAITLPLVADIHFDYRLALAAIENGADKIRLNPGNIGDPERVQAVLKAAKEREIPIRVGVNAGSLEKSLREKYGGVTAEALAESAVAMVRLIESMDFSHIVVSLKASDVRLNYDAHCIVAKELDYPLHIGITESGTVNSGKIKSAAGIGALLLAGIGDTMRVSLTGDPVEEVHFARELLQAVGVRRSGIELISCPTCGRTRVDLVRLADQVEKRLAPYQKRWAKEGGKPIKIAVMGCEVNGPGEASDADMGIAFGNGRGALFRKGVPVGTYPAEESLNLLFDMIEKELGDSQD
ncbi:MAG: flavodoxin-dependent (E)-4-hydroxy-3-methylbut-2-enyl-diphosphate synthase [Anaerovoracaceae bacterium]|jgi:(E)-4-hydroxy-3-methylbut-2-enyl-diphosphate synthase